MVSSLKTIGVVGGGVMGAGIVQTLLGAGYSVRLKELNDDLVRQSLQSVEGLFQSLKRKGAITEEETRAQLNSLESSSEYTILQGADLVIEAVPELISVKKEVFDQLEKTCKEETIFASNTSSLPISELAGFTSRPSRVIGMHWFNPPQVMRLVEVVPGLETSQETLETVFKICGTLKKVPIQVKECAGFLVNRLLGAYVNEALFLLEEGCSSAVIDATAKRAGFPMGPISLGEMVGWDIIYHSNMTLFQEYGNRFALPKLFGDLYESGRWGAKVGKGFYPYEGGRAVPVNVEEHESDEGVLFRLLAAMVNEAIRCLDENVASKEDIDKAMVLGAGMPKGPIQWADDLGLDEILKKVKEYNGLCGERFLPSPLLKRKVAASHLGAKARKGFYQY